MIALVTGAGNPRGIGAACVRTLADRGATVAFTVMPGEAGWVTGQVIHSEGGFLR